MPEMVSYNVLYKWQHFLLKCLTRLNFHDSFVVFVALKEEQNQVKSQTQMVVDIVFDSINDKNSYENCLTTLLPEKATWNLSMSCQT